MNCLIKMHGSRRAVGMFYAFCIWQLMYSINCLQDSECSGMYSEWASLTSLIQNGNEECQSVLGKFPMAAGKEVAMAVVKQLAANLGFAQTAEPSPLTTDREVQWCMEASTRYQVM